MAKYSNQKSLKIKRNNVDKNTKEIYLCIYKDSIIKAANELNGAAYKLYTFLMINADGYELDLSPQYIENTYGMGRGTVHKALKELEEKGYLKQITENKYVLYENPEIEEKNKTWWDEALKTNKGAIIVPIKKKNKEPVNYLDNVNWDE